MSKLFEATEINGMKLSNRFVRSATWEGMAAEGGAVTPKLMDTIAALAKGGVGLIMTSHAYVRPEGQAGPWQLGIYKDELIEGLREMWLAVHEHSGRIVLQLSHAGFLAAQKLSGMIPKAPSCVEAFTKSPCQEMTVEDIKDVVESYGKAAARAKEAGFDGVEIHSAHGYLLNQFLSPALNKRSDDYGGPVENRAKAVLEVLERVRTTVGKDFPVLIKLNSEDFIEGGISLEDSVKVGVMLQEAGIDAIELSGGCLFSGRDSPVRMGIKSEDREAYFRDAAKAFKEVVSIPLILVGGMRSLQVAEKMVDEGYADYISMSRPFIREPDLINRWASGDLSKAKCVSDNQCFRPGIAGEGIYCVVEKKLKEKDF